MNKFKNDFQEKMERQLVNFKTTKQYLPPTCKKTWLYNDLSDNLFPPIRHGFLQYIQDNAMPLHDYINHVRSSQAYCINLFYPILTKDQPAIIYTLNKKCSLNLAKILSFQFEYSPDENWLGEWKSNENRPEEYVTSSDVRIDLESNDKQKHIFLIEVKFTESEFSDCGGFNSGANRDGLRTACLNSKILLNNPNECYLNGKKLRRMYFEQYDMKSDFNSNMFNEECPFKSNHQCLRNHALAKILMKKENCFVHFGLLCHEKNDAILKEWNQYKNLLKNSSDLFELTGIELIKNSGDDNLKRYYADRYKLK